MNESGMDQMVHTEKITEKTRVESFYDSWKENENKVPNMNDVIHVGKMNKTNEEYQKLVDNGLSESDINNGNIKRGDLLKAGFAFINRIGGGEKPLINVVLNGKDFGELKLLTNEELETVKEYQNSNPEKYGLKGENLDEIRKDMFSFLAASSRVRSRLGSKSNAFNGTLADDINFESESDYALVRNYYNNQEKKNDSFGKEFMNKYCKDIYPWEDNENISFYGDDHLREKLFKYVPKRNSSLNNMPSPFLDSGFYFNQNIDVMVNNNGEYRRLNFAVVHLLSRGLSEMGASKNNSFDQNYFTLGEYRDQIYQKDESLRKQNWEIENNIIKVGEVSNEEIFKEVASRLVKQAKENTGVKNLMKNFFKKN